MVKFSISVSGAEFNDNLPMRIRTPMNTVVLSTFAVWAVALASVTHWGLTLSHTSTSAMVAPAVSQGLLPVDAAWVAKTLGVSKRDPVAAPVAAASNRFSLLGVVAGDQRHGVAVIAADGKPAKSLRVGSKVEDGLVLQSVERRSVRLGASMDGPTAYTLTLPGARP